MNNNQFIRIMVMLGVLIAVGVVNIIWLNYISSTSISVL